MRLRGLVTSVLCRTVREALTWLLSVRFENRLLVCAVVDVTLSPTVTICTCLSSICEGKEIIITNHYLVQSANLFHQHTPSITAVTALGHGLNSGSSAPSLSFYTCCCSFQPPLRNGMSTLFFHLLFLLPLPFYPASEHVNYRPAAAPRMA